MVKATCNTELLEEKIRLSGIKTKQIAKELGISRNALYKKRKGYVYFRKPEVYVLCKMLNIDSYEKLKIFPQNVE